MRSLSLKVIPRTGISIGDAIHKIEVLLESRKQSLADAIKERNLYFRVSLVGDCNLSCLFCHNEGAPPGGMLDMEYGCRMMKAAASVGFRRIQFTGGEPLLHDDVAGFVARARAILDDVGITTNGTALRKFLPSLIDAGLARLHISLQVPVLEAAGCVSSWGLPPWLESSLVLATDGGVVTRLNLPVPNDSLEKAASFMKMLSPFHCEFKVFAILPEGQQSRGEYPVKELAEIVQSENLRREVERIVPRVVLRGYTAPSGIRCAGCRDYSRCKEQSHSLRLGADHTLRPCLATRDWDIRVDDSQEMEGQIRRAALLALDYRWG
jgi:molybdenum cofactor biosynthesis enzyme MoaA